MRWLPLVERWHPDFPNLDPAWVLGVIAQESRGDPYDIADDIWGSTGLMQVGPRSWTGTRKQLLQPSFNVYVGMRMLAGSMFWTEGGADIRTAMGAYNCGFTGLEKDLCGSAGGYKYADRILNYWVPAFRAELVVEAAFNGWLAELGYLDGFGKWDVVEEETEEEVCRIVLPKRRFRPRLCIR
ncbi:MAG: lytic transglycosylase domain-containing protein [Planctomycetota bacterium]